MAMLLMNRRHSGNANFNLMNKRIIYSLLVLLLFAAHDLKAQSVTSEKLHLYADRDYCLSGDTVWFKVHLQEEIEAGSNVARVQLFSHKGAVISTVAVLSEQQWAEGFVHVPDSLSTGVYFISAFINEYRYAEEKRKAKTVFVYNRFQEDVNEILVADPSLVDAFRGKQENIEIETKEQYYLTRDKVSGSVKLSTDEIEHAVLSIKMLDPLAVANGGIVTFNTDIEPSVVPSFAEKDGLLISGRVLNDRNEAQKNALVLLSISSEPPYFDYCVSDENGGYNFFLKNAVGTADIVVQAMGAKNQNFVVETMPNTLGLKTEIPMERKFLNPEQRQFVKNVVKANFINKLFNATRLSRPDTFNMPPPYPIPFYGIPTKRVTPGEFFDLPDFREISRELLHGIQYRTRNDQITIRLLNLDRGQFFANEPLRMLNGIPVFKNEYFTNLKSTDISYIDIVQSQRVFGDLQIDGVLAVSLVDKTNPWLAQQNNLFSYKVDCLQTKKPIAYLKEQETNSKQPSIKHSYLWEQLSGDTDFEIKLSDLKGKLEISVEGVTKNNQAFKTSKIIEVK